MTFGQRIVRLPVFAAVALVAAMTVLGLQAVPAAAALGTTTSIGGSPNPATQGQLVTFTATVTPTSFGPTPTGTVAWTIDGISFGSTSVVSGQATLSATANNVGSHSVVGTYSGDGTYFGSQGTFSETVNSSCGFGCSGAPVITQQPSSQTVPVGGNASFTSNASGTPAPTVLWMESTNGGATFFSTGVTSTTLTVTGALASQNGIQFEAVWSNTVSSVTSSVAVLTVGSCGFGCTGGPVITQQPSSVTVPVGGNASFTSAATGSPAPTVLWMESTNAGASFFSTGVTTTTLTVTGAQAGQNGIQFEAVWTNTGGSVTSSVAVLTVGSAGSVVITVQPSNQTVPVGGTANFFSGASGAPSPTVLWMESTNGGATFFSTGVTTSALTVSNALLSQNGIEFEAVWTNSTGSVTSAPATLFVTNGTPAGSLQILTNSLPGGTAGSAYADQLSAIGGTPPYFWGLAAGSGPLPTGLTLSSSGLISGVPSAPGTTVVVVQVRDSGLAPATSSKALTLTVNSATSTGCAPGNAAFVCALFGDVLGRPVDTTGFNTFTGWLNSGAANRFDVAFDLLTSAEHDNDSIASWYQQFLHRAVDPNGQATDFALLQGGVPDENVIAGIIGSPEYVAINGGSFNAFVSAVYLDLLDRPVDPGGAALWVGQLQGGMSYRDVALSILRSQEYRGDLVDGWYVHYLHRHADPQGLSTWTGALSSGQSDEQVQASILSSDEYFSLA
jgi:hypothetical protein